MPRMSPINPPTYPKGGTYGELLRWHLDIWGTRADGERKIWKHVAFAKRAMPDTESADTRKRTLFNWMNRAPPVEDKYADLIETLLFGSNPTLQHWKEHLQRARSIHYERTRKRRQLRSITGRASSVSAVPRPVAYFLGPDEAVKALAASLTRAGGAYPVLIQGGPGMGKTELTKALAHSESVGRLFGGRRWFVRLEAAPSAAEMQNAILVALGHLPSQSFEIALKTLRSKPGLLVLDNLETPWESPPTWEGRRETEALLEELGKISGLAILASFRGQDNVGGLHWDTYFIDALTPPADHELFCQIAGHKYADDPHLRRLLEALAGIPLAIVLVALQAIDIVSLAELWRRWEEKGARLACHPDFAEGRITSLVRSAEFSLDSPRLGVGRELFRLLGQLPGGLAKLDQDALLGTDSLEAGNSLIRTGLGLRRGERITLLPPIRDHAARYYPPDNITNAKWIEHFARLAQDLGDKAFRFDGLETRRRVIPEISNIEASVVQAVRTPELYDMAVATSRHLRRLFTNTGMGNTSILHTVADACRSRGNSLEEGKLCVQISILAQERGNLEEAWTALERGLAAFRCADSSKEVINGEGDCLYRMADIHLYRSRLSDARELYLQAKKIYELTANARGLGDCIYRLGDIEWRRGNLFETVEYANDAEQHFKRAGFDLGISHCAWLRAQITLDVGEYDQAETLFAAAKERFQKIDVPLGLGHCRMAEGYIALGQGRLPVQRACLAEA